MKNIYIAYLGILLVGGVSAPLTNSFANPAVRAGLEASVRLKMRGSDVETKSTDQAAVEPARVRATTVSEGKLKRLLDFLSAQKAKLGAKLEKMAESTGKPEPLTEADMKRLIQEGRLKGLQ